MGWCLSKVFSHQPIRGCDTEATRHWLKEPHTQKEEEDRGPKTGMCLECCRSSQTTNKAGVTVRDMTGRVEAGEAGRGPEYVLAMKESVVFGGGNLSEDQSLYRHSLKDYPGGR